MENPLVSVNMVVLNGELFIKEAINSILNQTFNKFELIIVDDGSTDNTAREVELFNDNRIKLIKNQVNKGIVSARNQALDLSSGEYIAILDADDISLPNRLELEVSFLNENPDFGLVGGKAELINEKGGKINRIQSLSFSAGETKVYLLFNNCFTHSTVMYRKKILNKFRFNENTPVGEDYDIIVKIASQKKVKNLPDIIGEYRLHSNNITKKHSLIDKIQRGIISRQLEFIGLEPNESELDVHLQMTKNPLQEDLELLILKAKWLNKLYTANSNAHYFPEVAFNKRISGYWLNLMNNSKVYNTKLIPHYFKSPIRKNSNRNTMDDLKFFLKCLVNKKQIFHPHS